METISKKVLSIEFGGKKYVLSEDITIEYFLASLGFEDQDMVLLKPTREGFTLSIK